MFWIKYIICILFYKYSLQIYAFELNDKNVKGGDISLGKWIMFKNTNNDYIK